MSLWYIRSVERRIERVENEAHDARLRRLQALSVALMVAGGLLMACSLTGLIAIAVR